MRILRSGRFFFVAQWVAPWLVVLVILFGRRTIVDVVEGRLSFGVPTVTTVWVALVGIAVVAPVAVPWGLVLLVPALITLSDRDVQRCRRTRWAYSATAVVAWTASVPASVGIPGLWEDAGLRDLTVIPLFSDVRGLDPTLQFVGVIGCVVGVCAWAASVILATLGAVVASRRQPAVTSLEVSS